MMLSETERRHVEMMAATIAAGMESLGHFAASDLARVATVRAFQIREFVRETYTKEPTP